MLDITGINLSDVHVCDLQDLTYKLMSELKGLHYQADQTNKIMQEATALHRSTTYAEFFSQYGLSYLDLVKRFEDKMGTIASEQKRVVENLYRVEQELSTR